jgi:hypothetical protein
MPKLFVGYLAPGWTLERLNGKWIAQGLLKHGDVFTEYGDNTFKPHLGFTKNGRTMWLHIQTKSREAAHNLIRHYALNKEKIDGRALTVTYYKKSGKHTQDNNNNNTAPPTKYRPGNHYE